MRPQLDLVYAATANGSTRLLRRYCRYPFSLTGSFGKCSSANATLSVIPQSASGGLFEGDDVRERHVVGANASVRLLDQGSLVVHRACNGRPSQWRRHVEIGANANVACLNSPLVMLPGAQLVARTTLVAHATATILLTDGIGVHTPSGPGSAHDCASVLPANSLSQSIEVRRTKHAAPIAIDRYEAVFAANEDRWFGTVMILLPVSGAPAAGRLADAMWRKIDSDRRVFGGVTELANEAGLAVRLIAPTGGKIKQLSRQLCALVG